ncbi:hypothetical protein [Candidatus Phytoplasma meliae]|uniref:Uncharacterized protein n=1 Tax=Candidatus Phytoplasma meliae TaxID=1848402 RepID=A0ABS5CYK8_9MOLU|nr:hypothetical protein [Candidatus Phytoplasma meliae]MBP5836060.1 hypothetical protein [Candidatus Phytoplasma meliae]
MLVIFKKELDKDGKKQIDEDKTWIRNFLLSLVFTSLGILTLIFWYYVIHPIQNHFIKWIIQIILIPVGSFSFILSFWCGVLTNGCSTKIVDRYLIKAIYCKKPKEYEKHKYQPYQEKKIDKTTVKSNTKFTIVFFTIAFILFLFACYIKWQLKEKYMMDVLADIIFILSKFFSLPIFIIFCLSYIYGFFQKKDETKDKKMKQQQNRK